MRHTTQNLCNQHQSHCKYYFMNTTINRVFMAMNNHRCIVNPPRLKVLTTISIVIHTLFPHT